jgi:hypothetical protein
MTTKHVFIIDASALDKATCIRNLFWTVVQGYREPVPPQDLVYGSAFHKFAELLDKTDGNIAIALKAAKRIYRPEHYKAKEKKAYMTPEHLTNTCMEYFLKCWQPVKEGKSADSFRVFKVNKQPLVEMKFCIPFYSCSMFEILLAGTIDKLGQFGDSGVCAIGDYKTSSSWNHNDYFTPYKTSQQFRVYSLVIKLLADKYPQSIYAHMLRHRLSYFIEAIFVSAKETQIQRSTVFHVKPADLEVFHNMLKSLVDKLAFWIHKWLIEGCPQNTLWLPPEGTLNGSCKQPYGHCPFIHACGSPDSIGTLSILRNCFKQKPYNPLEWGTEYDNADHKPV